MQWIQVTILRVPYMPCPSEYFSDRECLEPLYRENFDEEDFDGVQFSDGGLTSVRTTYHNLPSSGHSKSFKIVDDDNNIMWREQMQKEIFRFPDKLIDFDHKLTVSRYENEVLFHIDHLIDRESENLDDESNLYIQRPQRPNGSVLFEEKVTVSDASTTSNITETGPLPNESGVPGSVDGEAEPSVDIPDQAGRLL